MKTRLLPLVLTALVLVTGAFAQAPAAAAAATTPAVPEDAAALNHQSIDRLKNKDAKSAVELAERATKADPTKAEYFAQLGIALSQRMTEVPFMQMAVMSGKLKKAFEKAVALDPDNIAGLIGLARFHTNAPEIAGGSLEKAAEFGARLEKINPFLGAIELGRIAEKGENYADALAHFETASKLKPDNAGLQYACGFQLAKLGRKDEARTRFEAALKLDPNHERSQKALAELDAPAPAPAKG
jgi:Flp pilus assembly protein TadD